MAACSIQFVQGATTGPVGQALLGATGTPVVVSNGLGGAYANYTFTVIAAPPGSAVPTGVVQSGTSPTWAFTPDLVDCYLVQLTVTDSSGNTATDVRAFGVNRTSGRIIPPFFGDSSSLNFSGVATGWDPIMRAWLEYLDTVAGGSGNTTSFGGAYSSGTVGVANNLDLYQCSGGSVIFTLPVALASGEYHTTQLIAAGTMAVKPPSGWTLRSPANGASIPSSGQWGTSVPGTSYRWFANTTSLVWTPQ